MIGIDRAEHVPVAKGQRQRIRRVRCLPADSSGLQSRRTRGRSSRADRRQLPEVRESRFSSRPGPKVHTVAESRLGWSPRWDPRLLLPALRPHQLSVQPRRSQQSSVAAPPHVQQAETVREESPLSSFPQRRAPTPAGFPKVALDAHGFSPSGDTSTIFSACIRAALECGPASMIRRATSLIRATAPIVTGTATPPATLPGDASPRPRAGEPPRWVFACRSPRRSPSPSVR